MRRFTALVGLCIVVSACAISAGPVALDDEYVGLPGQELRLPVLDNDFVPAASDVELSVVRGDGTVVDDSLVVTLPSSGSANITYRLEADGGESIATATVEVGDLDVDTVISAEAATLQAPEIMIGGYVEGRIGGGPWVPWGGIEIRFDLLDMGSGVRFPGPETCVTDDSGSCFVPVIAAVPGHGLVTAIVESPAGTDAPFRMAGTTYELVWFDAVLRLWADEFLPAGTEGLVTAEVAMVDGREERPAPGVIVTFAVSEGGVLGADACETNRQGVCAVTVISDEAQTLSVEGEAVVWIGEEAMTRRDRVDLGVASLMLQAFESGPAPAGSGIEVTAQLERDLGDGGTAPGPGERVAFRVLEGEAEALIRGDDTCVTDEAGRCSVVVVGRSGGGALVEVSTLDASAASVVIELRWIAARIVLSGPSTLERSEIGEVLARLEANAGYGWEPVPDAEVSVEFLENTAGVSLSGDSCATDDFGHCTVFVGDLLVFEPPAEFFPGPLPLPTLPPVIFPPDEIFPAPPELGTGIAVLRAGSTLDVDGIRLSEVSEPLEVRWVDASLMLAGPEGVVDVGNAAVLEVVACRSDGSAADAEASIGTACPFGMAPVAGVAVGFSLASTEDDAYEPWFESSSSCVTDSSGACQVMVNQDGSGTSLFSASATIVVVDLPLRRSAVESVTWEYFLR